MKRISVLIQVGICVLLFSACAGKSGTTTANLSGDTIVFRHAENISIIQYEEYTRVELQDPWDANKLLHTYILVNKEDPLPSHLPKGTLVRTPLERTVVYSSVHCSLLKQLDALNRIAGVCDVKYIRMPEIQEAYQQKRITDVGDGMNPNVERIIDLHPEAILLSPFENSGGYGRIDKLNIPLIECADYMETSPLGRAEWMRFYGLLFGKAEQADSLFATVEQNYQTLKALVAPISRAPSVMCDLKTSSTWYTPGGNSTIAKLYADAGANYIFRKDKNSGSLAYSFEIIFDKGQQADYWLIRYNQPTDKTYQDLKQEYAPYTGFRAFQERNIYGCNTGRVPFYEEIPFQPDWLLKDLIKIFHPLLLSEYELRYFCKLAEK